MKKKTLVAIGLSMMMGALAFTGCANANTVSEQTAQTESAAQDTEETADTDTAETAKAQDAEDADSAEDIDAVENGAEEGDAAESAEEEGKDILSIIALYDYDFSSGVGAWGTSLHINEDGSFSGDFHDTDAGESGDGYDGVVYLCQYTGQFTIPVRVSDYVYKMQIESISYANESGTEEIEDGMLLKYSDPYGLEDAKDIYIYLIGTPLDELPEEYLSWVTGKGVDLDGMDSLPFCGIYNESQQEGFSGTLIEE